MGLRYTLSDTKFINPYNFVPVDFAKDTKTNNVEELKEGLKTGVIKCSIHTKTPIAILDTENKKSIKVKTEKGVIDHTVYPFLRDYTGAYMIPGSTLRGMVRNVYETLTESCFSTMDEADAISERVSGDNPYQAGVLMRENGEWKLYSADRYKFKVTRKRPKNDDKEPYKKCNRVEFDKKKKEYYIRTNNGTLDVYSGDLVEITGSFSGGDSKRLNKVFKAHSIAAVPEGTNVDDKLVGYVVIGEEFSLRRGEKGESIFRVRDAVNLTSDEVKKRMTGLEKSLKDYRNESINKKLKKNGWYPAYERMKENGVIPIWYTSKNDKPEYFSMAAIGRKTFHTTMGELVGEKAPCTSRTKLCDACSLFGMANDTSATGSRIRFMDAVSDAKVDTIEVTLKELGVPRPSYLPFYANVNAENYQKKNKANYDTDGVTIRGRKFYWHTTNWKAINNGVKKSKLNSTVNVLDENQTFTFDIYYDGITEAELDKLIYSLNFWENEKDGKFCHKVGHGKPIGFGSIKITVDEVKERTFSKESGYKVATVFDSKNDNQKFDTDCKYIDGSLESVRALRMISDIHAVDGQTVCYPFIDPNGLEQKKENDFAAHKWFTENKSGGLKDHNHPIQFLPGIEQSVSTAGEGQETLLAYKAEFVPDQNRNKKR